MSVNELLNQVKPDEAEILLAESGRRYNVEKAANDRYVAACNLTARINVTGLRGSGHLRADLERIKAQHGFRHAVLGVYSIVLDESAGDPNEEKGGLALLINGLRILVADTTGHEDTRLADKVGVSEEFQEYCAALHGGKLSDLHVPVADVSIQDWRTKPTDEDDFIKRAKSLLFINTVDLDHREDLMEADMQSLLNGTPENNFFMRHKYYAAGDFILSLLRNSPDSAEGYLDEAVLILNVDRRMFQIARDGARAVSRLQAEVKRVVGWLRSAALDQNQDSSAYDMVRVILDAANVYDDDSKLAEFCNLFFTSVEELTETYRHHQRLLQHGDNKYSDIMTRVCRAGIRKFGYTNIFQLIEELDEISTNATMQSEVDEPNWESFTAVYSQLQRMRHGKSIEFRPTEAMFDGSYFKIPDKVSITVKKDSTEVALFYVDATTGDEKILEFLIRPKNNQPFDWSLIDDPNAVPGIRNEVFKTLERIQRYAQQDLQSQVDRQAQTADHLRLQRALRDRASRAGPSPKREKRAHTIDEELEAVRKDRKTREKPKQHEGNETQAASTPRKEIHHTVSFTPDDLAKVARSVPSGDLNEIETMLAAYYGPTTPGVEYKLFTFRGKRFHELKFYTSGNVRYRIMLEIANTSDGLIEFIPVQIVQRKDTYGKGKKVQNRWSK